MSKKFDERYMRLDEVLSTIPVCRATWYKGMKTGRFPKSVHLTTRCVFWRESDILRLLKQGVGV